MAFLSECDQCGQNDDHPKVVTSDGGNFHHDCVNAKLRAQLVESNDEVAKVIEACEGGLKGDKLREKILKIHGEKA